MTEQKEKRSKDASLYLLPIKEEKLHRCQLIRKPCHESQSCLKNTKKGKTKKGALSVGGGSWKAKGLEMREGGGKGRGCNKRLGYHGKFRARKKEPWPRCQANQSRAFIEQIGQWTYGDGGGGGRTMGGGDGGETKGSKNERRKDGGDAADTSGGCAGYFLSDDPDW